MPIRMTDDPIDPNEQDDSGGGGGRGPFPGGAGGLGALLPLILGLFRSKGGIVLLLILGGAAYFLLGRGGCNGSTIQKVVQQFSSSGYNFNRDTFNKASIYEELTPDDQKNPLPEAVSLLRFAPERGDQGQQGSCVAWSSAYGAQTILFSAATHEDPNKIVFSPAYLYNQISMDGCDGSYIQRAMETMQSNGGLSLSAFPYNDQDCSNKPGSSEIQQARKYQIHGFTRLTNENEQINIRAIKEHLAKDVPVVIGMLVGQSFMQDMMGKELWEPGGMDESQMGMGGHALCVIGFDDRKFGGAFQVMNSWTENWGVNGIAWIKYGDFKNYVREAYGLDPVPKRSDVANIPLECNIGLVNNANAPRDTTGGGQYIHLRMVTGNLFETVRPVTAGTRFKMEIKNVTECYIYIFGQETDGSSYVLFPYMKPGETFSKHSPYCGITGYRLFPKGQSMEADTIGHQDFIAVVVSKDSLNYQELNRSISQSSQADYHSKVNEALRQIQIPSAQYSTTSDGTVHFKVDANNNKAVAFIVAIDKQ
jgi:hypothetical protein